jgi:hypothetical protein
MKPCRLGVGSGQTNYSYYQYAVDIPNKDDDMSKGIASIKELKGYERTTK